MRAHAHTLVGLLSLAGSCLAAEPSKTTSMEPCTATNTKSGSFYDLRPDMVVKPPSDGSKPASGVKTEDYKAVGFDYGLNFTMNFCAPVVGSIANVRGGVSEDSWKNISAYYTSKGDTYSLGLQSSVVKSRGKKLVLQYTGGSYCGTSEKKERDLNIPPRSNVHQGAAYKYSDYGDEEDRSPSATVAAVEAKETDGQKMRKSATISFLCDRDPMASAAVASFVGVDPYECAYFFEVRSPHACAGAEPTQPGSVGPGTVFGIILLIAILVYLGGGIFYQRNVANQRGWRQLPNYTLWASIWSYVSVSTTSPTQSELSCELTGNRTCSSPSHRHARNFFPTGEDITTCRARPRGQGRAVTERLKTVLSISMTRSGTTDCRLACCLLYCRYGYLLRPNWGITMGHWR
jgi:cation-dependent mannose-6-phosphate receptor